MASRVTTLNRDDQVMSHIVIIRMNSFTNMPN